MSVHLRSLRICLLRLRIILWRINGKPIYADDGAAHDRRFVDGRDRIVALGLIALNAILALQDLHNAVGDQLAVGRALIGDDVALADAGILAAAVTPSASDICGLEDRIDLLGNFGKNSRPGHRAFRYHILIRLDGLLHERRFVYFIQLPQLFERQVRIKYRHTGIHHTTENCFIIFIDYIFPYFKRKCRICFP